MAKKRESFNKKHPELREGEVFISNISSLRVCSPRLSIYPDWPDDNRSDWECIGWKTKRMGNIAYDIHGRPINGMHPVFAQRAELQKDGVDPDRMS